MALTKKRRLVLANYTSNSKATLEDSLIKAGYSAKRAQITAIELRKDPEFIAAIERKQTQALERLERGELTEEEVVSGIRDIDAEAKAAGPVAAYLTIRLKAHELLCKIKGMLTEKVEFGFGAELAKEIEAARQRTPQLIEGTFTENKPN